jgi:hypothetical protein
VTSRRALFVFVGLTVLHTWPLASAPWRESLNHNADAQYAAWSLSWVAHTIASSPSRVFDGNIFAPESGTLAYSEPVITPALVGAPLIWLGASPVLVYNLLLLAGLVCTGWMTWHLVHRWTGSSGAGLVSGALAAFNVHLLTRLPHLMAAQAWTFPLILLLADRLRLHPRRREAALLALAVAATAGNSLYALAFGGLIVAVVGLAGRFRPAATAAVAAASVAGVLLALPVLLPYLAHASEGHTRPLETVAEFSATPAGYLTSTSLLHEPWTSPLFRDEVNVFFAGMTALVLAGVGLVAGLASADTRRRVLVVAIIGAGGVFLSLGPATAAFRWLYEWVLPLQGLRAAARFGYLYLFAIALAAGFGTAWLQRRLTSRAATVAVAAALCLVTIEAWHGPVPSTPFRGIPRIYSMLAEHPDPVLLVEVPFFPPEAVHENGPYVLNASAHLRPVMNGHSGFTPLTYRRRAESFWFFPEDWAIDAIRAEGATHVMVHLELFRHEAPGVVRALLDQPDLWLVAADTRGHLLYEVIPAPAQPGAQD